MHERREKLLKRRESLVFCRECGGQMFKEQELSNNKLIVTCINRHLRVIKIK